MSSAAALAEHRHMTIPSSKHRRGTDRKNVLKAIPAGFVVALAVTAIGIYRAVVIGAHGEPAGVDFGNWLMFGHQTLGHPISGSAKVTYPPLVPVTAVGFTRVFGVLWGEALFAGLAGIAPAVGIYAACRINNVRWAAVPGVVLLAATSSTGEAVAWGGMPQLVGFGLAAAALGVAVKAIAERSHGTSACLGILLLATGATSHLVLAQTVLAITVLVLCRLVIDHRAFARRTWLGKSGWVACTAIAVGPLLLLVPLYVRLLSTVGQSFVSGNHVSPGREALTVFMQNLWVVYRDVPWLWKVAIVVTAATPLLLFRRRSGAPRLWSMTTALVASLLLQALLSGEPRLAYLAPLAVAFALTLWLTQVDITLTRRLPQIVATIVVAAVGLASWQGLTFFPAQRAYYGAFVPNGSVEALNWIRHNTAPTSLIAVAPENGVPYGWWVQGYGRRAALVASDEIWLNFPAERERAQESVALFTEPDPLDDVVMQRARALHVDYLAIPWTWGGLSRPDLAKFQAAQPQSVVFNNGALVIIKVPS